MYADSKNMIRIKKLNFLLLLRTIKLRKGRGSWVWRPAPSTHNRTNKNKFKKFCLQDTIRSEMVTDVKKNKFQNSLYKQ